MTTSDGYDDEPTHPDGCARATGALLIVAAAPRVGWHQSDDGEHNRAASKHFIPLLPIYCSSRSRLVSRRSKESRDAFGALVTRKTSRHAECNERSLGSKCSQRTYPWLSGLVARRCRRSQRELAPEDEISPARVCMCRRVKRERARSRTGAATGADSSTARRDRPRRA